MKITDQTGRTAGNVSRIPPISSLRFVLAMWVVMGHLGIPFLQEQQRGPLLWALRAFRNNAFNGPAAVMVFFVISGFCIHFPNRKELSVRSWKLYYARRYVRILIPMAAALALAVPLRMRFGLFNGSILWSLVCEEIYYFLYPSLLFLRDRIGWRNLMTLAWVLALLTALTNPTARHYPSFGPALTWLLGLPCWLLGCRLAERLEGFQSKAVSSAQIWCWRISAYVLSVTVSVLDFHTPLTAPWMLDAFAVFAAFWLEREIRYYHATGHLPPFENLGEASYSIYLTHTHGFAFLFLFGFSSRLSPSAAWLAQMVLCLSFAGAFYWLIERPSHRFARRVGKQPARVRVESSAALYASEPSTSGGDMLQTESAD